MGWKLKLAFYVQFAIIAFVSDFREKIVKCYEFPRGKRSIFKLAIWQIWKFENFGEKTGKF